MSQNTESRPQLSPRRLRLIKMIYWTLMLLLIAVIGFFLGPRLHLAFLRAFDVVPTSVVIFDPVLGWRPRPSSEAMSLRTGHVIRYRIDENGERAIDNSGAKPSCRLVALGDSNTFGDAISMEEHFLTQTRKILPNLEIRNLGMSGYGLDQELLRFRIDGAKLAPQIVMVYVKHFNDDRHMHAVRWGKAKPYFLMDSQGSLNLHTEHIKIFSGRPPEIDLGYTDIPRQKIELGIRILNELQGDVRTIGGKLFVLSGVPNLCSQLSTAYCVDVQELSSYPVISTAKEDLYHLNFEGSRKMAEVISAYLKHDNLLPEHCL